VPVAMERGLYFIGYCAVPVYATADWAGLKNQYTPATVIKF